MRMLFIGDIVGRPGREVIGTELPGLRERLKLDFVIANAENVAGGFGITRDTANDLFATGCDVLTTGNHWLDQREILTFINDEDRILRPRNYPKGTAGRGANLYQAKNGGRILVINVMGRVFMDALDDPFAAVESELSFCALHEDADAILVDIHAEATSEKMAIHPRGYPCRGHVGEDGDGPFLRRPRQLRGRDPQPCADRRRADPARRDRLPDRCRGLRRL
jgi:2',3'-cyclic-nucleotide 2'-phosphodiesterase